MGNYLIALIIKSSSVYLQAIERDVVHRMNEEYRAWGALKSVLSNRGLSIKAKKCLYEGVHTLSGRIGKVVASHAVVARSCPAEVGLIYTMHVALRGHCPRGWGCDHSIGSTVFDAIVRSWLLLTATMSSPLGCFSTFLQIVDN